MKIGIISDTHGNLAGWQRAMAVALSDADLIIHCGDVLYHGPKFAPAEAYAPRALAEASNACAVPVLLVRGNGDSDVDQLVLNSPLQQPYLFAQVEGLRILATHGHLTAPDELVRLGERWRVDLLLTGHTHVAQVVRSGRLTHINPGSTTYPLSDEVRLQAPTCATWENGEATVWNLDTGEKVLV